MQSRYYDPQVGRFISMDQVEYLAPDVVNGLNLYVYCLNNPVMGYDPEGTWLHILAGALIGAVVGVVGQVISDVATSVITGEMYVSGWESYVGAAVGGVITAATGNAQVGVLVADAATGFFTTASTMVLTNCSGKTNYSEEEILKESSVDALSSAALGILMPQTNYDRKFSLIDSVIHGLPLDGCYGLKNAREKIDKWAKRNFGLEIFS